MNTSSLFHNPILNFIKEVFLTAEVCYGTACLRRCGNWRPLIYLREIKRHKFRLAINLTIDMLFLHTASLKSRCFLFIFIILVFILVFRLVRELVFLNINVNVYLKEIPCLNKVTLPYLYLKQVYQALDGRFIDVRTLGELSLKAAKGGRGRLVKVQLYSSKCCLMHWRIQGRDPRGALFSDQTEARRAEKV